MYTDEDVKRKSDITVEGYYWLADTTVSEAAWGVVWVEADGDVDDGEPRNWIFGVDEFDCFEDVEEYHVLLGPIVQPTVAIPFERIGVSELVPVAVKVTTGIKVVNLVPPLVRLGGS